MWRCFLAATMWFVLSGNVAQTQHKFSGWIFQAPPGWHTDVSKEDVVMVPLDLQPQEIEAGEAVGIIVYPGEKLTQDFRVWFDNKVAKLKGKAAVLEEDAVSASETEQNIPILSQRIVLHYPDGKKLHRLIWSARLGKRAECLIFITTSHELYQRYRRALDDFLRTICFVKHPCPEYAQLARKKLPDVPVTEQTRLLIARMTALARTPGLLESVRDSGNGRRER